MDDQLNEVQQQQQWFVTDETKFAIGDQLIDETFMQRNQQGFRLEEDVLAEQQQAIEFEMQNDRKLSAMLSAQTKTFGDSKLMKAVKSSLYKVDAIIFKERRVGISEENFDEIEAVYFEAIKNCTEYCKNRDSSGRKGIERKLLVERNKNRLIRELECVEELRELTANGHVLLEAGVSLKDLIMRVRLYNVASAPEDKRSVYKERGGEVKDKTLVGVVDLFKVNTKTIPKNLQAEYGQTVGNLRRELEAFPSGKAYATYIDIMGTQVLISQDETGNITLRTANASTVMEQTAEELLDMLDAKMIEEQEYMSDEDMLLVLGDQRIEEFYTVGTGSKRNGAWVESSRRPAGWQDFWS